MNDLLKTLADVREKMGYDPLPDPGIIQGMESGPPSEPFPVRPPVDLSQVPDGPDMDDEVFEDESPLIPKAPEKLGNFQLSDEEVRKQAEAGLAKLAGMVPPDLAVVATGEQCLGSFQGREVALSASEQAQVKRVVLKALQRQVQAQLSELQALLPKRKRKARALVQAALKSDAQQITDEFHRPAIAPKRRGRPPKQRLDGSVK